MIFSNERQDLRQVYFDTWTKHLNKQPLEPLEQQVLHVIMDHPEYQRFLAKPDRYLDKDFFEETDGVNPFLHMGLHLGLREQIATERPSGITGIYKQLVELHQGDYLNVEHGMMHCLAMVMQQAQVDRKEPDIQGYLRMLRDLLKTK